MQEKFISKDSTLQIRGILMLLIMFHHILNTVGYPKDTIALNYIIRYSGYLSTSIFFFLSGYGNWMSLSKTNDLDFKWLPKRILPLYSIFIPCFFISWIYYGHKARTLFRFAVFSLPDAINWFPKIIMLCFVLLFITWKLPNKKSTMLLSLFGSISIYVIVCVILKVDAFWYNSVLCFPLGCLIAEYKEYIQSTSMIKTTILFFVDLIMFVLVFALYGTKPTIQILLGLMISIASAYVCTVVNIKSKLLRYFGKHSFELYLIHVSLMKILNYHIDSKIAYGILLYICSISLLIVYTTIKK